jgi:ribonuclease Z
MELLFLGTGAGLPSKERNVSALALSLLQELNSIWLFDCGEATQHQILHTSIKPRKISKIFITHLHGDHIFGLPGLLSSRSFQGGNEPCTIYGPQGIKKYIETSLEISSTHLTYPLHIVEFTEGKLFEDEKFIVDCKKLDHGIPSYGFRIIEKDKPGELLVDKLIEAGIKPGPIYREIKENSTITLDSGQIIHQVDFIGEKKSGKKIIIFGDTRHPELNKDFVAHADILVHEATYGHEKHDLANKYFHSTTSEVAKLAKDSNIKKLVLTHVSSRYQKEDYRQLLHEAQSIFPKTALAKDFFRLSIK